MARVALYFDAKRIPSPRFGPCPVAIVRLMARMEKFDNHFNYQTGEAWIEEI